jgi:hypothetical protein
VCFRLFAVTGFGVANRRTQVWNPKPGAPTEKPAPLNFIVGGLKSQHAPEGTAPKGKADPRVRNALEVRQVYTMGISSAQGKPMGNSNIFPLRPKSRDDADETAVTEQVEQIPGEMDIDRVIKAQASMAAVRHRITELENSLWAAAEELFRLDPKSAVAERAKAVLKDRLEIETGGPVSLPSAPHPARQPKEGCAPSFLMNERDEMDRTCGGEALPGEYVQPENEKEDGGES